LWPLFIASLVLGGLVSGEKTSLTAVIGARLIDGLGGPPRESSTILIEGRKIAAIGDYGRIRMPERARVIDARGCDDIGNTRQMVSIWHDGREIKPRVPASAGCSTRSNPERN
jgi:hypothetical protein